MARLLLFPERRPGRTIAGVGLVLLLAYAASLVVFRKPDGRVVIGDAVHYYVYLRSVVFDGDLHFRNEYVRLYGLRGGEEGTEWVYQDTPTGHVRNMMSVGPPLVWAPLFLALTALSGVAAGLGAPITLDGFGRLFQASAGVSGLLASIAGAWLSYRFAARRFGPRTAIWSTLMIWLGSHAVYYSGISPTYSHAASMLVVSALFLYWDATRDRAESTGPLRYATLGALAGACALVRWQDAVFLIVPVVDAAWDVSRERRGAAVWRAFRNLAVCGLAAIAVFTPQIATWMILYGQPVAMPQGGDWMQWAHPRFLLVLFSDWHGLFTWTPIIAVAVAGLVPLWRRDRRLCVTAAAVLLVSWYANAAVLEWWAGEAYGARRFVSCFPLFVVGLAALLDPFARHVSRLAAAAAVAIALNGLLLLQYQLFMHGLRDIAPYPRGLFNLACARFVVPFRLLAWLAERM